VTTQPLPTSRAPGVLHKLAILRDERTRTQKVREVCAAVVAAGLRGLADAGCGPLTIRTRWNRWSTQLADRTGSSDPSAPAWYGRRDARVMPTAQVALACSATRDAPTGRV